MTFEGPDNEDEFDDGYDDDGDSSEGEGWKRGDYDESDADRWKDDLDGQDGEKSKELPEPPKRPNENIRRKFGESDAEAENRSKGDSDESEKSILKMILERINDIEKELKIIEEKAIDGVNTPGDTERKKYLLKKLSDLIPNSM